MQPLPSWTMVRSGLYDRGVVWVELVSENSPSGDGGESTSAPESIDKCVLVVFDDEILSWHFPEAVLSPLLFLPELFLLLF